MRYVDYFAVDHGPLELAHIRSRAEDYYLTLVGELFDRMRNDDEDAASWARLANALAYFSSPEQKVSEQAAKMPQGEAALFAAAAFYCGGFPASAYLTIKSATVPLSDQESVLACFDLLGRPHEMRSRTGVALLDALRHGNIAEIDRLQLEAVEHASAALETGPDEWITARILEQLLTRISDMAVVPYQQDQAPRLDFGAPT